MTIKTITASLLATALLTTTAYAGGFSRGSANLDGLYASEDGSDAITAYSGVTLVNPGRSYDSITGVTVVNGRPTPFRQGSIEISETFLVPYASVGIKFNDDLRCVNSYSVPYGGDSSYEGEITYFISRQEIETYELGATCSYGFDVGRGQAYAIGGVFYEALTYSQARNFNRAFPQAVFPISVNGDSSINVSGDTFGYRIGAAYEIPEIALRASLIYRSETDYDVDGSFTNTPFAVLAAADLVAQGRAPDFGTALNAALGVFGTATSANAFASATLPRQVELNVRSGVAPGTLVFGSVRWTDWSVVEQIDLFEGISGSAFTNFRGFFEDGFTVTVGGARAFNDDLAGSIAFTYDQGVGSGYDTFSDTYSVAAGLSYDLNDIANIRAGGALLYFTDDVRDREDPTITGAPGYVATSPNEFGYALSTALNIKF